MTEILNYDRKKFYRIHPCKNYLGNAVKLQNILSFFRKGYVSDGGRMKKRCRKDGHWTGRDSHCQLTTCHAVDQLPPEVVVEPPDCAQVS